ncbi:MAG: PIN domain-containing protein [Planctomycetaceae bacterium]|nr:PIN domain-containing protein [Planctomycetaceae bacterium]
MLVLIDTGVLLRLFERLDPNYGDVQAALKRLWSHGDEPVIAAQNAVEFWNVSTRPATARGGFGQSLAKTRARLAAIERICRVLPESPSTFVEWKRLVVSQSLIGVSVHDARIAAQMAVWQVGTILTLNPSDFRRFPGIAVLTPSELMASAEFA